MRILVTGAAGFIGRHLVRSLLEEGHAVAGIDNFVTSVPNDLRASGLVQDGLEFIAGDVSAPDAVGLLAGKEFDEIYHLACPTGVPNLGPLALEMLVTSFDGTRSVLEIARSTGARVLFASSAEIYGNPQVSPQSEDYCGNVDPLGPRNGYEEGKRVGETLCSIYAARYGVNAKVARIFNTYGPGMALDETRVVPAFVRGALEGRPMRIHGAGTQTRCHMFVADLVRGLRAAMRRGAPGRAFNLGSTHPVSVVELAEAVNRIAGASVPMEFLDRPSHDHDMRLPDITRARTELGWRPEIALDEGLRLTIDDFRGRLAHRVDDVHREALTAGDPVS